MKKLIALCRLLYLSAVESGMRGDDATIDTTMSLDPDLGLPLINVQIALAQVIAENKESKLAKPLHRLNL